MIDVRSQLVLDTFGSFYVGGRTVDIDGQSPRNAALSSDVASYRYDPNGTYAIEHAYVAYYVPSSRRPVPVVLVHGGGMTGSCWESTPDGRPGWLLDLLRDRWSCYVVDSVERGRAGWCSLPGIWAGEPILRNEQDCWTTFRIGPPDGYAQRMPFAGSMFPVQALRALTRQMVPRWTTTDALAESALSALLERLDRCILVGHSQGGGLAARVAQAHPQSVQAAVLIEPAGLPDPPPSSPQLIVIGDNIERHPVSAALAEVWSRYARSPKAGAGHVDLLDLTAAGHRGNTHVLMCDRNSSKIAALVMAWLAAHTEAATRNSSDGTEE